MQNLTKIQIATIALIVLYIIWEIGIMIWERTTDADNVIRVDRIMIYPVIAILVIISLYQYFKR